MIQKMRLLHYLSESTYKKICVRLGLSDASPKIGDNFVTLENQKVYRIHLFNILYEQFGHVWFLYTHIDFPKFDCSYQAFEKELFMCYSQLFGQEIMADFPLYDEINCDYVEYMDMLTVENASRKIALLENGKCVREQLDRALWNDYKKAHGTIALCICKEDDTHLTTLARCYGTALKKRFKDTSFHRATGVTPSKIVNENTEKEIMNWLYKSYGLTI